MKIRLLIAIVTVMIIGCGSVYAAHQCPASTPDEFGDKTAKTITGTADSAVKETANIAETSVNDPIATPKTAIQAVKNTASTALVQADKAMKSMTGEE